MGKRLFKYERVAEDIIKAIESGLYAPGERLPSLRALSSQQGISISTVMQAYYLLEAQGWIEARQRSGFFVRTQLPNMLPEPETSQPMADPSQVSMRELVTRVVHADWEYPDLVRMGAAHPNPELSGTAHLNRSIKRIARELGERSGMYDYVPGSARLRVQIARRALLAGCSYPPDEVIITNGCSEAVNLCLRAVCQPGDTVAIESPMIFDALLCLDVLGLKALEIPTHPQQGISLPDLEDALKTNHISAVLVISNFNNPLGSCIPEANKQKLAALAEEYRVPVIENDIFGELYFDENRPAVIKAYDREGWVMLCSSFSKVLSPGYRVGWVVPGRYLEMVEWLKYTTSLASPTLNEYAIADFISGGRYQQYLRRIRREYARRVAGMSQAVRRNFPPECKLTRPSGGFVLWVELPGEVDSIQLYRRSLRAGIAITPGYLFSASDQYRNFIRLNAANWSAAAEEHVQQLGEFIQTGRGR